jgi:hypothetical protein
MLADVKSSSHEIFSSEHLRVATWNIAAVNNNPFEYWVTHNDPSYNRLMADVQSAIDCPQQHDKAVSTIFTEVMFQELLSDMENTGLLVASSRTVLEQRWQQDIGKRCAISGFLADKAIGAKRLASMPDRITNTIRAADGSVLYRPAVINCFAGDLSGLPAWWGLWRSFMFATRVRVHGIGDGEGELVCRLLEPISRAKYPALTEEEEAVSVPLQVNEHPSNPSSISRSILASLLPCFLASFHPSNYFLNLLSFRLFIPSYFCLRFM